MSLNSGKRDKRERSLPSQLADSRRADALAVENEAAASEVGEVKLKVQQVSGEGRAS